MKERLMSFMQAEGLSSLKLAEAIGVQPSAISHILSERNKPGFEFLSNMLKAFPTLNPRWLMLGEGNMYIGSMDEAALPLSLFNAHPQNEEIVPGNNMSQNSTKSIEDKNGEIPLKVESIVMLYTDGSFKIYKP